MRGPRNVDLLSDAPNWTLLTIRLLQQPERCSFACLGLGLCGIARDQHEGDWRYGFKHRFQPPTTKRVSTTEARPLLKHRTEISGGAGARQWLFVAACSCGWKSDQWVARDSAEYWGRKHEVETSG